VNDQAVDSRGAGPNELDGKVRLYKRDFWGTENLRFAEPHFRLRKMARVVRLVARGKGDCDLLDLGCGPAALARLMPPGARYHGIDIAIPQPGPNLMEMDLTESPVAFRGMKFDIIVAQGLFEYLGDLQSQKFAEIAAPRPQPLLHGGPALPRRAQLEPQPPAPQAHHRAPGARLSVRVPVLSRLLAVDYFYICTPLRRAG